MRESLFTEIFQYRQSENHSPLENYTSTLFANCLKRDKVFFWDFLGLLGFSGIDENYTIDIQKNHSPYGIPDIEICGKDLSLIIECKIESVEGKGQLDSYAKYLANETKTTHKHLVYLTKYYERKEIDNNKTILHYLRWLDIYKLIRSDHQEMTLEFKQFLKDQNMESIKNFTVQDMLAMKVIPSTITKMDEVLDQFKEEFETKFGGFSRKASRSTCLIERSYLGYVTLKYQSQNYNLFIGFMWDSNDEVPLVGLSVEIPLRRGMKSDLEEILNQEFRPNAGWEYEHLDSFAYIYVGEPLTVFITQPDDSLSSIKKYLSSKLSDIYMFNLKNPEVFKKNEHFKE